MEPPLTERQHQILSLVREGMTNQQVAHQLGISPGTVRKHLENSYWAAAVISDGGCDGFSYAAVAVWV